MYAQADALYRDLHQSPELSGKETQTAAKMATGLRQLGYDVTTRRRWHRRRRRVEERSGADGHAANRAGRAARHRSDRLALRQHGAHQGRQRGGGGRDARVRPRRPHGRVDEHGADHGGGSNPLVGDADAHRAAGRGADRRCAGHVEGRPVHEVSEAGLCDRDSRRRAASRRRGRLPRRSDSDQRRQHRHHDLRPRRARRAARVHGGPGGDCRTRGAGTSNNRVARELAVRPRGDHGRHDPRRHEEQHHPRRGEAAADGPLLHPARAAAPAGGHQAQRQGRGGGGRRAQGAVGRVCRGRERRS